MCLIYIPSVLLQVCFLLVDRPQYLRTCSHLACAPFTTSIHIFSIATVLMRIEVGNTDAKSIIASSDSLAVPSLVCFSTIT